MQSPNMNHETGIHFGVIHQNNLDGDSLDKLYFSTNSKDLGYESAVEDAKKAANNFWDQRTPP